MSQDVLSQNAKELTELFKHSQQEIGRIGKESDKKREEIREQEHQVHLEYNDKVWRAVDIRNKALERLRKQSEKIDQEEKRLCEPFDVNRRKARHIITLLKVTKRIPVREITDSDVKNYRDKYLEWIDGYVYDTDYLKVRLLIAEND